MIYYHNYSPTTGEYLSSKPASPSPKEPGKYLIPAHATLVEPPQSTGDAIACWNGSSWVVQADLRGKRYWDKNTLESYVITDLSTYPQENWTDIEPPDPYAIWSSNEWIIPLPILKERKIAQIRAQVDLLLNEIQKNFSQAEFLSWTKQESGAKHLSENPDSTTNDAEFVRAMASARGVSVEELVQKIVNCITPYSSAMALMLGEQQRREDLVNAAQSADELSLLNFDSPPIAVSSLL